MALLSLAMMAAASAARVILSVDGSTALARSSPALTSVTIDVCALKQGLNFSDPLLRKLSAHLGRQGAVLRIGGTDQNSFVYDMKGDKPMQPCECGHHDKVCTMTAPYWRSVHDFLEATDMQLIFGLNPSSSDNANELVYHTAHQNYSNIKGYSFGNEQTGGAALAAAYHRKMQAVRAALEKAYSASGPIKTRPLLVGADTGVGPRKGTTPATLWTDAGIREHLAWIGTFVAECHDVLDAVTWHTYDYRATEIGATDHHPLPYPVSGVPNASRLWDPAYYDVAARLADNVTATVRRAVAGTADEALAGKVWLSETNSVNHQGVWNVTNAYLNSLWLVDRFGLMAGRGVQFMARQSLIGYNYSLLGNFPEEPILAAPDYYTTVLFQRLFGPRTVLRAALDSADGRLRAFAFCSVKQAAAGSGLGVALVNLHESQATDVVVDGAVGGELELYELTPDWPAAEAAAAPSDRATSRRIALNGKVLQLGPDGSLPAMEPRQIAAPPAGQSRTLTLQPLTFAFAVFPSATASAC